MIIPNKSIRLSNSLLGMGSQVILNLKTPQTISSLWERIRKYEEIRTYEKFILTLDLLYILGLIDFEEGILKKKYYDKVSSQ